MLNFGVTARLSTAGAAHRRGRTQKRPAGWRLDTAIGKATCGSIVKEQRRSTGSP
jgi:hypothetical protein